MFCAGFFVNVAFNTTVCLAQMMCTFLLEDFNRNWLTKIMGLFSIPVLKAFKKRLDPRRYNGASFLGLNGIVIKSHGGTDAFGFRYAIETAIEEVDNKIIENIKKQLELETKSKK